jgi:predicted DNA-binding antitoxin AbrB/MazE fold protein
MEQKIYLDEISKLVVETDNGKVKCDGITAEIDGVFTVYADDVCKLLALLNDVIVPYKHTVVTREWIWEKTKVFQKLYLREGEVNNILVAYEEKIKQILQKNEELEKNNELLCNKIEKFNASRRPWERKFNLE